MAIMTASPPCMTNCRRWKIPPCARFSSWTQSVQGMVVHKPYKDDPAYPLKEWDVITKIGDTPVDDQGMIKLGDDLRVRFEYEIQHIATNGTVPLTDCPRRQGAENQSAGFRGLSAVDSRFERRLSLVFHLRAAGFFRRHGRISVAVCSRPDMARPFWRA